MKTEDSNSLSAMTYQMQASQWASRKKLHMSRIRMRLLYWEYLETGHVRSFVFCLLQASGALNSETGEYRNVDLFTHYSLRDSNKNSNYLSTLDTSLASLSSRVSFRRWIDSKDSFKTNRWSSRCTWIIYLELTIKFSSNSSRKSNGRAATKSRKNQVLM